MIDSGEWPTPLTTNMRDYCATVAQYNIASLNEEDIIEQKNLYIKAMTEPTEYDKEFFALNLRHGSFTVKSVTPLCMRYLLDGANSTVKAESGIWRLWYQPKNVPRAETLYKQTMKVDPEENKRIQHNIENTLDERKEGTPNPLNESLDDTIQRDKGEGKGEDAMRKKDRQNLRGKGSPIGTGEASSSNQPPKGYKKGDPAAPDEITRNARDNWSMNKLRMTRHCEGDYPRNFRTIHGLYYLMLDQFMEDLNLEVNEYSPMLQYQSNGHLKYDFVTAYNQKWLPRDKKNSRSQSI